MDWHEKKRVERRNNLDKAMTLLCIKKGWLQQLDTARRSITDRREKQRFFSFAFAWLRKNYNTCACPPPVTEPRLWPDNMEGSLPLVEPDPEPPAPWVSDTD